MRVMAYSSTTGALKASVDLKEYGQVRARILGGAFPSIREPLGAVVNPCSEGVNSRLEAAREVIQRGPEDGSSP